MGLRDVWSRALVYFGIAEEEYWDDDSYSAETELERSYADRPNVRRLEPRRRRDEPTAWSEPESISPRTTYREREREERAEREPRASRRSTAPLAAVSSPPRVREASPVKVHLVVPRSFNDAQSIADRFKDQTPVILNLQSADPELSKRLIDFSSGLTYALNGSMQRVADKVFLLTPRDVEVSAEERARLLDRGFFNQS
ncbi:MAG: cell division protein SepF [Thermoleophilia bacterium]